MRVNSSVGSDIEEVGGFQLIEAGLGDGEVAFVDFVADEARDFHLLGREGGGSDAEEGVEEDGFFAFAVDAHALLDEGGREAGGMRALGISGIDGLVGDEPVVSTATLVVTLGVFPAANV